MGFACGAPRSHKASARSARRSRSARPAFSEHPPKRHGATAPVVAWRGRCLVCDAVPGHPSKPFDLVAVLDLPGRPLPTPTLDGLVQRPRIEPGAVGLPGRSDGRATGPSPHAQAETVCETLTLEAQPRLRTASTGSRSHVRCHNPRGSNQELSMDRRLNRPEPLFKVHAALMKCPEGLLKRFSVQHGAPCEKGAECAKDRGSRARAGGRPLPLTTKDPVDSPQANPVINPRPRPREVIAGTRRSWCSRR